MRVFAIALRGARLSGPCPCSFGTSLPIHNPVYEERLHARLENNDLDIEANLNIGKGAVYTVQKCEACALWSHYKLVRNCIALAMVLVAVLIPRVQG